MSKPLTIQYTGKYANHLLREKEKEIEILKEQLNDEIDEELKQSEIMVKKQQEIERLNNIIKEVRDYIENHNKTIRNRKELGIYADFMIIPKELLEILDKEKDNE